MRQRKNVTTTTFAIAGGMLMIALMGLMQGRLVWSAFFAMLGLALLVQRIWINKRRAKR